MKTKPLGLDIGASSIKAVSFTENNHVISLSAALSIPSPEKGMLSESPLDQEEMAQAIKRVVTESKITTNSVNIALPENRVYTKVIEMPMLSDRELASAIYWQAEQYIPVPLETITLDWKILRKPEKPQDGARMDVLLVGAPTALIEKYQRVLTMAGLSIMYIETEILSAVRALTYPYLHRENTAFPNSFIINIGAVTTSFAIVKNGTIVFTYSIPVGGSAINRAIASDFGFSVPQAEEYKKVYGISQETFGGKIGEATKPILQSVITEVKKAVSFYNQKFAAEASLKQIVLAGGTAKLPGIDLYFAQNCEIETVIANPWQIIGSQQIPKEIFDNAADYTIAAGLALRDYE